MKLKHLPGHFRNMRSIGRLAAIRFVHPTANVCRRSDLEFPCHVGENGRLIRVRQGRYSYVARDTRVQDCEIGAYASIGPGCLIGGLGRHPTNHFSTSPLTYSPDNEVSRLLGHAGFDMAFVESGRVTIGPDVWIGARVLVADGVTIGVGAIIGANTVVTKDVPPYAVFFGSPPEVRRYRFSPAVVARLMTSRWWTATPSELNVHELIDLTHESEDHC